VRVLLSTVGSTGDLNPFLALGRSLARAGHEPVVFTARAFAPIVLRAGLGFRDSASPASEAGYEGMLRAVMAATNPLQHAAIIFEQTCGEQLCSVDAAREAAGWADVVVAHAMDFAAVAACEATGCALLTSHLFPTLLRARDMSPTGRSFGRLGNAIVWEIAARMTRSLTDRQVNRVFTAFGLPPRRDALFGINAKAARILLAVSPSVVPCDARWRDRVAQTGYWLAAEPDEGEVDSALARFVADGDPPVVVSFGSMSGVDGAQVSRTLIEALRRSGRRAVLQSGWAGLGEGFDLPPNVHRAGYVPHGWLLPRASCLVHHGGAGTTAAAFRAGIPQIVVWHMGDQTFWGQRVELLGVGPARLHHRKLTADRLVQRIDRVFADPTIGERARVLGERVRSEDGLGEALRAIETAGQ
jgi:sterol 3beta-glucosyltransferase